MRELVDDIMLVVIVIDGLYHGFYRRVEFSRIDIYGIPADDYDEFHDDDEDVGPSKRFIFSSRCV